MGRDAGEAGRAPVGAPARADGVVGRARAGGVPAHRPLAPGSAVELRARAPGRGVVVHHRLRAGARRAHARAPRRAARPRRRARLHLGRPARRRRGHHPGRQARARLRQPGAEPRAGARLEGRGDREPAAAQRLPAAAAARRRVERAGPRAQRLPHGVPGGQWRADAADHHRRCAGDARGGGRHEVVPRARGEGRGERGDLAGALRARRRSSVGVLPRVPHETKARRRELAAAGGVGSRAARRTSSNRGTDASGTEGAMMAAGPRRTGPRRLLFLTSVTRLRGVDVHRLGGPGSLSRPIVDDAKRL